MPRRHSSGEAARLRGVCLRAKCDGNAVRHAVDYRKVAFCDARPGSALGSSHHRVVYPNRCRCGSTHPRRVDRLCFAVLSVRNQQFIACRWRQLAMYRLASADPLAIAHNRADAMDQPFVRPQDSEQYATTLRTSGRGFAYVRRDVRNSARGCGRLALPCLRAPPTPSATEPYEMILG